MRSIFNDLRFFCLFLVCVSGCLCGCTITTANQGEVGFRFGNELTFFHRAAQTAPQPAVINTEVPALVEWFLKDAADGPPAPPLEPVPPIP